MKIHTPTGRDISTYTLGRYNRSGRAFTYSSLQGLGVQQSQYLNGYSTQYTSGKYTVVGTVPGYFPLTTSWSMTFWVKPTDSGKSTQFLFSRISGGIGWNIEIYSDKVTFVFDFGTPQNRFSFPANPWGFWQMFGIGWDSGSSSWNDLYGHYNGTSPTLTRTINWATVESPDDPGFSTVFHTASTTVNANALIDEICFFNQKLTPSEFNLVYNSGAPTDNRELSGLAAKIDHYYLMGDNDDANTIHDISGGYHGTNYGGVSYSTDIPS